MLEIIRISHCNNSAAHPSNNLLIAAALVATLCSFPVPVLGKDYVMGTARFENQEIADALLSPPVVPSEAQGLASSFLEETLPKLLTDDSRLARQLGFSESADDTVTLDRALPLIRIYRNDILSYLNKKSDPLSMANNDNNWRRDQSRRLIAKRMIFPVKIQKPKSDSGSYWSSITLEQSPSGTWRIIQAGAPKLSQAVKRFERSEKDQFLLWIPDLNRHYLGRLIAKRSDVSIVTIKLTTLFEDRLTHRSAGQEFEITDEGFIKGLLQLIKDLEFPKKSRRPTNDQPVTQSPIRPNPNEQDRTQSR